MQKVIQITEEHRKTLVWRRMQTLLEDSYGNIISKNWLAEIRYFIDNVVVHVLNEGERRSLRENYEAVAGEIDRRVATLDHEREIRFNPSMSPVEFEHFCAAELQAIGRNARVTKASGDQGSDIIAEKDGIRIVLHCKLYNRPIGNKAVQEISAARLQEGANGAVVVTNTRYTPAAQQLAKTNDVLLLHYSELRDIEEMLRRWPADLISLARAAHSGSSFH
jgi:restriction system protein